MSLLKTKRGFGLVVVLGIAAVLAIFTGAIGASATMNLQSVTRESQLDQAHYAAFTGVQLSMACIKEPPPGREDWLETDPSIVVQLSDKVSCTARTYHNLAPLAPEPQGGAAGPAPQLPGLCRSSARPAAALAALHGRADRSSRGPSGPDRAACSRSS